MFSVYDDITLTTVKASVLPDPTVHVDIARFDLIHPLVSGNKLYKLHYFIEEHLKSGRPTIVTCGGAYSNHLAATASFCCEQGITSIGLVRGDELNALSSHTLQQCSGMGMKLHFIERDLYRRLDEEITSDIIDLPQGEFSFIPEGGYHTSGMKGASLMMNQMAKHNPDYVCVAAGTFTTLAGFASIANQNTSVIGFPVLKGMDDFHKRWNELFSSAPPPQPELFNDYHYGGYARFNQKLISFMNSFYDQTGIPTDFVYTGKMISGVWDLLAKGYFKKASRIIIIHTGGLQGNRSLPTGILNF